MAEGQARTEQCDECGVQIVTEPSWADEHIVVDHRMSGGMGYNRTYYCSEECVGLAHSSVVEA